MSVLSLTVRCTNKFDDIVTASHKQQADSKHRRFIKIYQLGGCTYLVIVRAAAAVNHTVYALVFVRLLYRSIYVCVYDPCPCSHAPFVELTLYTCCCTALV
jgi:hypothetical protein